jgi:DNA-binding response OmpR family regulator
MLTADRGLLCWLRQALINQVFRVVALQAFETVDAAVAIIDDRCLPAGALPPALARARRTPTLVLLPCQDASRVATLLECGADDAMCAPFLAEELCARTRALLRRADPRRTALPSGKAWYDRALREVRTVEGSRGRLTASESILLESLLEARGDVVTRETLLARMKTEPLRVESNVVERHVATLRAKLGDSHRHPCVIETVCGRGYRLRSGQRPPFDAALA